MKELTITVNKDFTSPRLEMNQDTYESLNTYFTTKLFPALIGNKAGSQTDQVRMYIRALCLLHGISNGKTRTLNLNYLKAFIGYAPSSTRMKTILQDFNSYGVFINGYTISVKDGVEEVKYRINLDNDLIKMFKQLEDATVYSLKMCPDKYNGIAASEYIIKEWKKWNKETKQQTEEPEQIEEPVVEKPVEEDTLKLQTITGTKPTKVNRDTVAVLTKIYNMKQSGMYKHYEDAAAYHNAHIREYLKDYPNAATELSVPTIRNLFKVWYAEDGGEMSEVHDSSLF